MFPNHGPIMAARFEAESEAGMASSGSCLLRYPVFAKIRLLTCRHESRKHSCNEWRVKAPANEAFQLMVLLHLPDRVAEMRNGRKQLKAHSAE